MPEALPQRMQADRLNFPGMLPREVVILKSWLQLHETEYDRFEYNVRIGEGVDPGSNYTAEIRAQAIANTQKRLDAVAWKGSTPTIIEVKDRAQLSALGQLVGYYHLWRDQFPGGPEPKLMLLTNRATKDTVTAVTRAGIDIQLVEADFAGLRSTPGS